MSKKSSSNNLSAFFLIYSDWFIKRWINWFEAIKCKDLIPVSQLDLSGIEIDCTKKVPLPYGRAIEYALKNKGISF